jgi:hypothetical protein
MVGEKLRLEPAGSFAVLPMNQPSPSFGTANIAVTCSFGYPYPARGQTAVPAAEIADDHVEDVRIDACTRQGAKTKAQEFVPHRFGRKSTSK